MPEVNLIAVQQEDRNANERAKGIECVLKTIDENNSAREILTELAEDAGVCGTGIAHEYFDKNGKTLKTVRIDPREFFVDEKVNKIDDAADCIWRREFSKKDFLSVFGKFDGAQKVQFLCKQDATDNIDSTTAKTYTLREIEDFKNSENNEKKDFFVRVYDYWNVVEKKRIVFANNAKIFEDEIEKLDFTFWYFSKNNDSIWGIGLIEICAPEVFALDNYVELAFRNAKSKMQKMIVGDGGVGFHTGLKQAPNGIWVLNDLGEKRVADTFAQIELGGVPNEFFGMHNLFLDNLTISSQQDQRALYANPNQLATQTKAKKESFQKRIRTIMKRTMWRSLRRREQIRVKLFQKNIAELNENFFIDGYFVLRGEKANPTFIKDSSAFGIFRATQENTKVEIGVRVVSARQKAEMNEEEQGRFLQFFQLATNAASVLPEVAQGIDWAAFVEEGAELFGRDKKRFWKNYAAKGKDKVAIEQRKFLLGVAPKIPDDEDFEELLDIV